jgi:hypothetical protein
MKTKSILVSGLFLLTVTFPTFANDLHQDGVIYDFKDFAVFASHWMDVNCSQSDWCNGCDFDMNNSVDFDDLWGFVRDWLFITAEDIAAMAARDAADAGFEHAYAYMIESFNAAPDKQAWLDSWYDPDAVTLNYSFGPVVFGDAEFQYDIYKGNEVAGYEIVSTGAAGSVTHTVHASISISWWIEYPLGFGGITAKGSMDIGLGGGIYTIPSGGGFTIQTHSITSPPAGGVVLRQGLTVPGEVVIGPGGDPDVVVIAKRDVVIENGIRVADYLLDFPPIIPPAGLPPDVLVIDPCDPDPYDPTMYIISDDGEFVGAFDIGTTTGDPQEIKIDGNNGVDVEGEIIPLKVFINGDMTLGSSAKLTVTAGSAVDLYLGGTLEAKNGSIITYSNIADVTNPSDAFIIEATKSLTLKGTESCTSIVLKNSGDFYGLIYAPQAYTEVRNSGDFYGAIISSDEVRISNSGDFYYGGTLFDFPSSETIYMGLKHGSWWEDFISQPDIVKETFESVVRKSSRQPCQIEESSLTVYYYSVPNTTGDSDLEPDSFARFYLGGTYLILDTGTYDSDTGATILTGTDIVAKHVIDVQFSAPTIYADVEMTVTFIDRTVDYSASRHN